LICAAQLPVNVTAWEPFVTETGFFNCAMGPIIFQSVVTVYADRSSASTSAIVVAALSSPFFCQLQA